MTKKIPSMSSNTDNVSTFLLKKNTLQVEVLPNSESVPCPPTTEKHRLNSTKKMVTPGNKSMGANADSVSISSCSHSVKSNYGQDQQDLQEDYRDPGEVPSLTLMINPCEYDANGRCVRHPLVRLRKKKDLWWRLEDALGYLSRVLCG